MKLYFNKFTKILGLTPTAQTSIAKITAIRNTTVEIELVPVQVDGTQENFAGGTEGVCVVKTKADFDGPLKLIDASWTVPQTVGAGYVFEFLASGASLDATLGTLPKLAYALQIAWEESGRRGATPPIELEVLNDYYRADDPAPEDPADQLPIPGNVLVKTAQALSEPEKAQVRTNIGLVAAIAAVTQAEAEAGTEAALRSWSPVRVKNAIAAFAVTPYGAGNITGTVTLVLANGTVQSASLTGAVTLAVPTGGVSNSRLELWLKASGANRNLDFASGIKRMTDSAATFPKTLTSGLTYVVVLKRLNSTWCLVSLGGGLDV